MCWRAGVLAVCSMIGIGLVGCADDLDLLNVEEASVSAGEPSDFSAKEPPEKYVDHMGHIWVRSHQIEYVDDDDEELVWDFDEDMIDPDPEPDPTTSTDQEYGEYFRPISDIGGWEFHLADESVESYGAFLRERAVARLKGPEHDLSLFEGIGSEVGIGEKSARELPRTFRASIITAARIIGADERTVINHLAHLHPWVLHGHMDCTAFKAVNHYSAVTAAHCVHNGKSWKTRHDIQFSAGSKWISGQVVPAAVPSGCYTRTVPGRYVAGANLPKNDYAVIAFRGHGAWCPTESWNFGYFGWKSVPIGSKFASHMSGYPLDEPLPFPSWQKPTLVYSYKGSQSIYTSVFQPNVVKFTHDTTGGQSGTPLISYDSTSGYQARAILKGHGPATNRNWGREFNGGVADFVWLRGGY